MLQLTFAKPNYWSWQVTSKWFNHPVVWIRISDLIFKASNKIDQDWFQKSEQTLLPDPIREHFWFMTKRQTHFFHYLLFFYYCLYHICHIMSVAIYGLTSGHRNSLSRSLTFLKQTTSFAVCCHFRVKYWWLVKSLFQYPRVLRSVSYPVRSVSWYCCAVPLVLVYFGVPLTGNLRNSQVSRIVVLNPLIA